MGGLRFPDLKLDIEAAALEPMEGQRRCALDRALWPLGVVDRARERSSVPRLRAAHQSDEIAGSPAPQAARRGGNNKFACYMWEGYRRHTGPELHTGGMRGSKPAGFSSHVICGKFFCFQL